MSFVLSSKNNLTTLCCFAMLGVGQQRKCCFNFGKDKLAQDLFQRFWNGKKPTVSTHNSWCPDSQPPLVIAGIFSMTTFFNTLSKFFPSNLHSVTLFWTTRYTTKVFNILYMRIWESIYTDISRRGKNTACYGSLLRCFSDKSSSKLTSPGVYRPWPTSLHSQKAYRRWLNVRLYFCEFISCIIFL